MAYQPIRDLADLPRDVKEYLPERAQRDFMQAFNQFIARGSDSGSAFQLAWRSLQISRD